MSIYKEKLLDEIARDNIPFIPNQLERVGSIFNTVQGRYTLIGSVSGVGKTSVVDDMMILKPYNWLINTKSKLHFETLYFSMERQIKFKLAKFVSWKLYNDKGIRISSDTILGYTQNRVLSASENKLLESFQPWMDDLLELVDIKDGAKSVADISFEIEKLRKKLGTLITTDNNAVYVNGVQQFKFKGLVKETKRSNIPIVKFKFKDKSYELEQNDKRYILHEPNTIVQIVIDHIGKTKIDGYANKKLAIDGLDEVLCNARDLYNFNPVAISQFNRSLSDMARLKYSKGNLEPMYEDFKDTGNPVESADLVLSLFDPYKYQSYDSKGLYKGYDIAQGMVAPNGAQRFRSLHIIKHSFGVSNVTFGLKFMGESMHFITLPKASEYNKLQKIYEEVAKGN